MQGKPLPDRIVPDAIVEALVEFRFEPAELPELVIGRLLDARLWAGYQQVRLPMADIPQPLREADVNLKYQPLVELSRNDGQRAVKIGGHVTSYHITGPYPGWAQFKTEIASVLQEVHAKLETLVFSRIGFRYINIFRQSEHLISGIMDTDVHVTVGDENIVRSLVVNYVRSCGQDHTVAVKVATPDMVTGNIQPGYSLLCDIDVATKVARSVSGPDAALAWIEHAHTFEKSEFFAILPESITSKLAAQTAGADNA